MHMIQCFDAGKKHSYGIRKTRLNCSFILSFIFFIFENLLCLFSLWSSYDSMLECLNLFFLFLF